MSKSTALVLITIILAATLMIVCLFLFTVFSVVQVDSARPTTLLEDGSLAPGIYLVGPDVTPGLYRGQGPCYWERLSDVSGSGSAIIANDAPDGQFYLEVFVDDYAVNTECALKKVE